MDLPVLPNLLNDMNLKDFQPTVFCLSDGSNCLIRNQDEIVQKFQKIKLSVS